MLQYGVELFGQKYCDKLFSLSFDPPSVEDDLSALNSTYLAFKSNLVSCYYMLLNELRFAGN